MSSRTGWKPVPVLIAILALALLAPTAFAAPSKEYTLSLDDSPAAVAGRTVTFVATFTNGADQQQQLGSANLTPPSGFVLVSASVPGAATAKINAGTVELRNLSLQPGSPSLTVSVTAMVPCAGGGSTWSVIGKQANNFKGTPGNDLTLAAGSSLATPVSGTCALSFVTQPTDAEVNAVITGAPFDPAGASVAVEVVDGGGARLTSWAQPVVLSPTLDSALGTVSGRSAPAVAGLATFSGLRIDAPGWYRLVATSGPLTSADSSAWFRIYPDGTPCLEDKACTATASTGRSKLTVTGEPNANPDAGLLTLSFDAGLDLSCVGYDPVTAGTAVFDVTGGRTKTATLQIDKREMTVIPNNGASFLNLCFGSEETFKTKSGVDAVADTTFDWDGDGIATAVYRGLLPDCGVFAPPCVSKRQKTGSGDGVIQALLPAGDPAMRG